MHKAPAADANTRQMAGAVASHTLVGGVATLSVPSPTEGAQTFLAIYDGDADCTVSTSAIYTQNAYLLDYYFPFFPAMGE